MPIRDHLIYMINVNKNSSMGFLQDITEEESMNRIDGRFNHIRWQVGHIIYHAGRILTFLQPGFNKHDEFKDLFAPGSTVSDNPDDYPALSDLKERLNHYYDEILSTLAEIGDEDLEREIGEGDNKRPVWKPITFLCMHNFYHTGQIMYNRRGVGKNWPFGE